MPPHSGGGARSFPIVGIGASAGGLAAFKRLFGAMPADTGMAFVLIPHLDPTHESLMAELLARHTAMPVAEARDGERVAPNHVYVIPPNADLALDNGLLRVIPPRPRRSAPAAIDFFLQSLAAARQTQPVGIILSGTGSHGTDGITAVKTAGGLVLAQSPESAEHDQMPRSAIASGLVDYILEPEAMPPILVRHAAQPASSALTPTPGELKHILAVLRARTKRDFRGYRTGMVLRRVKRRMGLLRIARGASYVEYLRAHPEEADSLGKDLAISITAFYRDPQAFQVLEAQVLPELVRRTSQIAGHERPVRVWVPGCATGEEAYSLAMLFIEQFESAGRAVQLQLFATDIDNDALDVARAGIYPDSIEADVSVERLRRFFVRTGAHHYQVSPAVREVVTFAPQNLLSDAPFSRLDLIACRNVLIYLDAAVQTKILSLFHFALGDGGYLFLGPAESVGPATDRFETVSKKWRVYRRISAGVRPAIDIPILPASAHGGRASHGTERPRRVAPASELLHRTLLASFAPAAVLINARYEILSVQGPMVDYLEFPPGELTHDLLAMARPGLRAAVRGACQKAMETHHAVVHATARVKRQTSYVACAVTARRAAGATHADTLLLVTFEDSPARPANRLTKGARKASPHRGESTLVRELEHDLQATRVDLQGTIDELQTSNEELKASHEEVMSMNEELQSTNEEMETQKEELQSLNEELVSVNSQLQDKVHELDAANSDMVNLLASSDIATVFLDPELRIKRFTAPTARLLNLLASDVGRSFRDIATRVTDPALLDDCRRVLEALTPFEAVVRSDTAEAYLRRVLPYRTADQHIDGVVITWVDITRRLAAEAESRHFAAVLRDSNDGVALLDLTGAIQDWNHGAERLYGYTEADVRTKRLPDLAPESHRGTLDDLVRRVASGKVASESLETERTTKDGRTRSVWMTMTLLRDAAGQPDALVTTERDVTEIREALAAKRSIDLYQRVIEDLPAGAVLREDGRIAMNRAAENITGYQRHELPTVDDWCATLHGDRAEGYRVHYDRSQSALDTTAPVTLVIARKDGEDRRIELTVCRLDPPHDLWMLIDTTEVERAERALRRSEDYLNALVTTAADAIVTTTREGVIDTFNPAAERMFGYTVSEARGQNVRLLMPSPYREEHDAHIARYLDTREARIIGMGREVAGRRKDGTTFPLDLAVSELSDERGFTAILRDLSERRALEWRLAESQLEERRHMARELHDGVGGHMTGIALLAQTLEAELERAQSPAVGRTRDLVESIDDAHQQLRTVIRGLMPVEALPEGLMAAIRNLVAQCENTSGIRCRFECHPPVEVADHTTALHLFRIAQEALNNALRHAKATRITVSLKASREHFAITITDNGRGLGDLPPGHPGMGLTTMRQRARLLGGDCAIGPGDGNGTMVRCWVPVLRSSQPATRK